MTDKRQKTDEVSPTFCPAYYLKRVFTLKGRER
jgi:hypothetical protein